MNIIVYEHVSGGGYAEQPIPQGMLAEGFAMLRCVAADFKAAGHQVTVLLDARISKLNPPIEANCTVPVFYRQEPQRFLCSIANINDAFYIIAPETGKTLHSLVEAAQKTGKPSLNSDLEAIAKVADKAFLAQTLRKNGMPTPRTIVLSSTDSLDNIKQAVERELTYPVIFKSSDGAGCSSLSIVKDDSEVHKALAKVKAESMGTCFVAQEFIQGESASVSLICTGKKALAISLNKQTLNLSGPNEQSSYVGGYVPFDHPQKKKAFALAERVAELFSGLRGYAGVDLVLAENGSFVVDVNPRLTTSYVGLRKVAKFNVAEAMADAVVNQKLPQPQNQRFCVFSKVQTHKPDMAAFQKIVKFEAVISPPFPIEKNNQSCALIVGEADSLDDAKQQLEEAKKRLHNTIT